MQRLLILEVLTGVGITTGVLLAVAISLVPGFRDLPFDDYVEAHRNFGRHFDKIMPPIVGLTIICMAILLAQTGPTVLNVIALTALAAVSVVSQFKNVPLNRLIKGGELTYQQDPRASWRRWHYARLVASSISLLAFNASLQYH